MSTGKTDCTKHNRCLRTSCTFTYLVFAFDLMYLLLVMDDVGYIPLNIVKYLKIVNKLGSEYLFR